MVIYCKALCNPKINKSFSQVQMVDEIDASDSVGNNNNLLTINNHRIAVDGSNDITEYHRSEHNGYKLECGDG